MIFVVFDCNCSGVSNLLILMNLLCVIILENGFIFINGMLIDCVYFGVNELMDE